MSSIIYIPRDVAEKRFRTIFEDHLQYIRYEARKGRPNSYRAQGHEKAAAKALENCNNVIYGRHVSNRCMAQVFFAGAQLAPPEPQKEDTYELPF